MNPLQPILLAEDDACDIELIINALQERHLRNRVTIVRDGVEALDYLYRRGSFSERAKGNPAVIFLDIKMPRLSGLDVLKAIKAQPMLEAIPVVMLTSSREEIDLVRSYELGASAYIVKPVEFHAFNQAIREAGVFWGLLNEPPPMQS